MVLYLHIVLLCVPVLSSFGFDFNNAEGQGLLQFDRETKLEHGGLGSSQVSSDKEVCEKAVNLQKILSVMISMLRQDISENAKTTYILETLKDLLKNTPGHNAEVMYKIDDLMKTLDKYKNIDVGDKKLLRVGDNKITPMITERKGPSNQNVLYQLPKLSNSYCTEALQSIIKIAYEAYVSLAKNPICNLALIPGLPFKPNPGIPESKLIPYNPNNLKPEWDAPHKFPSFNPNLPSNSFPPSSLILPFFNYIFNVDENTGIPTIVNPFNDKPISNLPDLYNRLPEYQFPPKYAPYFPQNPNNMRPLQSVFPNNPYILINNFPDKSNVFYHDNPNEFHLNPNFHKSESTPTFPYNPDFKLNPLFPWQNYPDISPYDINSQANPRNPYIPNINNVPKIAFDRNPQILNPSSPHNVSPVTPKLNPDLENITKSDVFPFDVNPNFLDSLPEIPDLDNILPHHPQQLPNNLLKPEDSQIHPYYSDFKSYPFIPWSKNPDVFPYAISPQTNQLNPYFPEVNKLPKTPGPLPLIEKPDDLPFDKNPNSPYSPQIVAKLPYNLQDKNKNQIFPFDMNPNTLNPKIPELDHMLPKPIAHYVVNINNIPDKYHSNEPIVIKLPYPPNNNPYAPVQINDRPDKQVIFPSGLTPNNLLPNNPYAHNYIPPNVSPVLPTPSPSNDASNIPDFPNSYYPKIPNQTPAENPFVYEIKLNTNDMTPNAVPNNPVPLNWVPNSPTATPMNPQPDLPYPFSFLPIPGSPQSNMQVPEHEIIGFIREAVGFIEAIIPVVKFDPPTLMVIAKIKDILEHSDKEIVDEYVTIIELYEKIISYVKQLNVYKELIDMVDLNRVTNSPKLDNKKVVELTYLLKRPQPIVYYPYYYVKYRLPFSTIMVAAKDLLAQKPYLRDNPKELYEELLALSKVAETSPDLKSYNKEDILRLTFKSGSLVDAKLITTKGTLNEQLNVLKDITSDFTAEDIMELNDKAKIQMKMLGSSNPQSVPDTYQIDIKANSLKSHMREKQNEPTTETSLDFTSFDSGKLRGDILRGENVGLPFSDNVLPKNMSPLHDLHVPISDFSVRPIAPVMTTYDKLYDATLEATKLRKRKQKNILNKGGLENHDDEKIYLNTGTGNRQSYLNIVNPKIMTNSAQTKQGLNLDDEKPSLVKQQSFMNSENYKHSTTGQENHYNSGGLVNYDNQKISLNSGTGNAQDHINFVNPKVMINGAETSDTNPTRSLKKLDQLNFMNFNAFNDDNRHLFKNSETTGRIPLNNQQVLTVDSKMATDGAKYIRPDVLNYGNLDSEIATDTEKYYIRPDVSSYGHQDSKVTKDKPTYIRPDASNYENPYGIDVPNHKMNAANPKYINEPTTGRPNLLNVGSTKIYVNSGLPNKLGSPFMHEETTIRQDSTPHDGTSILLNTGEDNKQNLLNFNNFNKILNNGAAVQDLKNIDITKILLNTGTSNKQNRVNFNNNKMTMNSGAAAKNLVNFDDTKIMMNTGTGNEQNSVSFNNNKLVMNNDQNSGKHNFEAGMMQEMFRPNSGNFNFDTGATQENYANLGLGLGAGLGHANPQSFVNFGAYQGVQGVPESHISSYQIQRVPILQRGPIMQKFTKSSFVLLNQFRRPVTPMG